MRKALLVTLALLTASRAQAQEASPIAIVAEHDIDLTAGQQDELKDWSRDVAGYRGWFDRYRNRVYRNIFGLVSDRRLAPDVPAWLPAKCELLADFVPRPAGALSDGCDLLAFYRSNFTVDPVVQQTLIVQKQNEEDPHASFWKHVHLDAGWTSLDYRANAYGLVGVHVTLPELAKRVQIYLPPGFLLVSLPDGHGGRQFQPAATVGVSVKMFRFEFPRHKAGTAYFNLAKAYLISRPSSLDGNAAIDLIGLSFAWGR
jgi:hypothetical protein